jgi:hypothetical protein
MLKSTDKPLDQMNRLADMAHFPAAVNAGATANVLLTLTVTWWLAPRFTQVYAAIVWTALVLCLNLLPVVVLRAIGYNQSPIPSLSKMDFFRDQHRFSDWVYLAASADMAFWILLAWPIFTIRHTPAALSVVLALAALVTFAPVLWRAIQPDNQA